MKPTELVWNRCEHCHMVFSSTFGNACWIGQAPHAHHVAPVQIVACRGCLFNSHQAGLHVDWCPRSLHDAGRCDRCNGSGRITRQVTYVGGVSRTTEVLCSVCDGSGYEIKRGKPCKACGCTETVRATDNNGVSYDGCARCKMADL